ncbi:TetR family transcriptional regulator [Candidatus Blastococcus massiliensis]|uniref:TetR family transcriptional regulator n=1 Tax=Candidatus Blastococcus massiliensis TaxID=1470358 RepID=UPI0009DEDD5B|nr:TetR family transcriptional regulator [Candidatus Blastococcus massiliensis]
MKAEVVRRSSQLRVPHDGAAGDRRAPGNVAQDGLHRESEPRKADTRPHATATQKARDRRDSRWDEHRRARREQLVDAAVTAIGRRGAGVGMEEIAAEAGTSKTVVYRHFTDRTDLYVAVCSRVAGSLLAELRAAMDRGDTPRATLAAAIETYLAFIEADPELYRFVVHPQGHHGHFGPDGDADPISTLSDLVGDQAAAILTDALEQAGRSPDAALPWGHGVVGTVRAAADWWLRAGRPMLRSELAAHLTDLAWAGLSGVVTTEAGSPRARTEEEL